MSKADRIPMTTNQPANDRNECLDDITLLGILATERVALCNFLETLAPPDWGYPLLCAGWTIKDVVAHLTLSTRETTFDFVRGMIRYRANFDRMTMERAKHRSQQFGADELTSQLRSSAAWPDTAFGGSLRDCLIDVIVHGQDIARPLERVLPSHPEHVIIALEHALQSRWYGARKRFANTKLQATDIEWTTGPGPELIKGSAIEILLLATSRPTRLRHA